MQLLLVSHNNYHQFRLLSTRYSGEIISVYTMPNNKRGIPPRVRENALKHHDSNSLCSQGDSQYYLRHYVKGAEDNRVGIEKPAADAGLTFLPSNSTLEHLLQQVNKVAVGKKICSGEFANATTCEISCLLNCPTFQGLFRDGTMPPWFKCGRIAESCT